MGLRLRPLGKAVSGSGRLRITAALRQGNHRRTKTLIQHKQAKLLTAHTMALCAQPWDTHALDCGAKGRADTSTLQEKAAVRSGRSKGHCFRPCALPAPCLLYPSQPGSCTPPCRNTYTHCLQCPTSPAHAPGTALAPATACPWSYLANSTDHSHSPLHRTAPQKPFHCCPHQAHTPNP